MVSVQAHQPQDFGDSSYVSSPMSLVLGFASGVAPDSRARRSPASTSFLLPPTSAELFPYWYWTRPVLVREWWGSEPCRFLYLVSDLSGTEWRFNALRFGTVAVLVGNGGLDRTRHLGALCCRLPDSASWR
jgi:hypothetical protein